MACRILTRSASEGPTTLFPRKHPCVRVGGFGLMSPAVTPPRKALQAAARRPPAAVRLQRLPADVSERSSSIIASVAASTASCQRAAPNRWAYSLRAWAKMIARIVDDRPQPAHVESPRHFAGPGTLTAVAGHQQPGPGHGRSQAGQLFGIRRADHATDRAQAALAQRLPGPTLDSLGHVLIERPPLDQQILKHAPPRVRRFDQHEHAGTAPVATSMNGSMLSPPRYGLTVSASAPQALCVGAPR